MTQFVANSDDPLAQTYPSQGAVDWRRKKEMEIQEEIDKKTREGWEALKAQHKDPNRSMRFNKGKLRWGLVNWKAMEPMVEVLMVGAVKYSDNDWMKGQDRMENLESAMRHLTAMMSGEILDPETGKPHVGHLMCCAMFNSYFDIVNPPAENEKLFDSEVNE